MLPLFFRGATMYSDLYLSNSQPSILKTSCATDFLLSGVLDCVSALPRYAHCLSALRFEDWTHPENRALTKAQLCENGTSLDMRIALSAVNASGIPFSETWEKSRNGNQKVWRTLLNEKSRSWKQAHHRGLGFRSAMRRMRLTTLLPNFRNTAAIEIEVTKASAG